MFFNYFSPAKETPSISVNAVAEEAKAGKLKKITLSGNILKIERKDGSKVISRKEEDVSVVNTLLNMGVSQKELSQIEIEVERPSQLGNWLTVLGSFLPLIIFGGLLLFMLRQAQSGSNQALSFGR
ncbi:MAG: cell division protein FtsH, partial [Anaerolineae bacterium]